MNVYFRFIFPWDSKIQFPCDSKIVSRDLSRNLFGGRNLRMYERFRNFAWGRKTILESHGKTILKSHGHVVRASTECSRQHFQVHLFYYGQNLRLFAAWIIGMWATCAAPCAVVNTVITVILIAHDIVLISELYANSISLWSMYLSSV